MERSHDLLGLIADDVVSTPNPSSIIPTSGKMTGEGGIRAQATLCHHYGRERVVPMSTFQGEVDRVPTPWHWVWPRLMLPGEKEPP